MIYSIVLALVAAVTIDATPLDRCDGEELQFSGTGTYTAVTQHLFVDVNGGQVLHSIREPAIWKTKPLVATPTGSYTVVASVYSRGNRTGLIAQAIRVFTIPDCEIENGEDKESMGGGESDISTTDENRSNEEDGEDAGNDDDNSGDEGDAIKSADEGQQARVKGAARVVGFPARLKPVNAMFRTVFHRQPTFPEWSYWANRLLTDKPAYNALLGAMQWHQLRGRTIGVYFTL